MKKMLFISAVAATMLFSGCGGGGGSSSTTTAGGSTTGTAGGSTTGTAGGSTTGTAGGSTTGTGSSSDPAAGNRIKDGVHADGTSNRPADSVVTVGTRDWLVIQTSEIPDSNATSNYNEAFFPKREWAEADNFCKNYVDAQFPNSTWALPTQMELLSIMTPQVTDVKFFDETTPQFVVDTKVLPSNGTLNAFNGAIFFDQPNKAVALGNGTPGSAMVEYTTIDAGAPEEAFFTCIRQ